MSHLEANIRSVQERIAAAAGRAGRDPADITLVAVTKTRESDEIRTAYELGLRHFGENRIEEAETKVKHLPDDITWHMIGHIQSRKAKRVVPICQVVHSLDSVKLARRLDRFCTDRPAPLPVLLECNISGEASKHGFGANRWNEDAAQRKALFEAANEIAALPHLLVQGLMTMAPIVTSPEHARPIFVRLRELRDALAAEFPQAEWHQLSMGMTDDFEVAIEEGSTMVRVGRAIFAPGLPVCDKG